MTKEKFLELLSRKLSGAISNADSEALANAIENNAAYELLATEFTRYFHHAQNNQPKTDQLNYTWKMIAAAEKKDFKGKFDYAAPNKTNMPYRMLLKAAAILIFVMGAGILGYNLLQKETGEGLVAIAATDEKVFRVLDDGTSIWLNKKSTLSYSKSFGKHKREIFLEGEAYFDVVKNKDIPLFIHAGNIDIEVKGTAFNVNAYKENHQIKVALVRGSIQVTDKLDGNHKIVLKPNEKLVFSNLPSHVNQNNFLVIPLKMNVLLQETKWTSDTLVFNKEKLSELIVRMEKKYDLKIEIQSEKLKEKRFSGIFINESIEQALAALKVSYPLTYTINNRLVVIKD